MGNWGLLKSDRGLAGTRIMLGKTVGLEIVWACGCDVSACGFCCSRRHECA